MSYPVGKIDEQNTVSASYFDNVARDIKESTDKYLAVKQVKRREIKKSWLRNRDKRHIVNRDKETLLDVE